MSKKIALIPILALLVGLYLWHQPQGLMHFNKAQQLFAQNHNQKEFELHKRELINYYTSGAYEHDVTKICATAQAHFSAITPSAKDVIIFDVDDTALYHYQWNDTFNFIWAKQHALLVARQQKKALPIEPVLKLYNFLLGKGFSIIFLTSRNAGSNEETKIELEQAGYSNFKELIGMPDILAFDRSIKTEEWKLSVRKKLSEMYTIIGNVGDREKDFFGGYNGYKVKLPNYLY